MFGGTATHTVTMPPRRRARHAVDDVCVGCDLPLICRPACTSTLSEIAKPRVGGLHSAQSGALAWGGHQCAEHHVGREVRSDLIFWRWPGAAGAAWRRDVGPLSFFSPSLRGVIEPLSRIGETRVTDFVLRGAVARGAAHLEDGTGERNGPNGTMDSGVWSGIKERQWRGARGCHGAESGVARGAVLRKRCQASAMPRRPAFCPARHW